MNQKLSGEFRFLVICQTVLIFTARFICFLIQSSMGEEKCFVLTVNDK